MIAPERGVVDIRGGVAAVGVGVRAVNGGVRAADGETRTAGAGVRGGEVRVRDRHGRTALLPVLFIAAAAGAIGGAATSTTACAPTGSSPTNTVGYGPDQMANAATIVSVGKQMNITEQGWVVAIATAMQESGLRNLDHGDRDSLGLFQQRPSQGWGTPDQITNPTYAATQFYQHLLAVPGWQQMSITDAAQAVQRSAYPDAYARHEQAAQQIVAAVHGATCTTATGEAPHPAAAVAVAYAQTQIGLPYRWGGDGAKLTELSNGQTQVTGGFDCSGLTKASWAAAGIEIPRTAHTQYHATTRVSEAELPAT